MERQKSRAPFWRAFDEHGCFDFNEIQVIEVVAGLLRHFVTKLQNFRETGDRTEVPGYRYFIAKFIAPVGFDLQW